MSQQDDTLSVSEVAALCGFNRNTVGLWIRSKKLRAFRIGKKYAIPVKELIYFLQSTGHRVPDELAADGLKGPLFRSFLKCWEYFQDGALRDCCRQCTVFENRLSACFTARGNPALHCNGLCDQCDYYKNIYTPRLQFLHQIEVPAAVCKDLNFWACNAPWARLSGVREKDLVGLGLEEVYHRDCLGTVIANHKRRVLGDTSAPRIDRAFFKNATLQTEAVDIGRLSAYRTPGHLAVAGRPPGFARSGRAVTRKPKDALTAASGAPSGGDMVDYRTWDWETDEKCIDMSDWPQKFGWVEEPQASPDGERVAAIVNVDEGEFSVCVNGEQWESTFDKCWYLRFSPDGRLTAIVSEMGDWTLAVDGEPWENKFGYVWNTLFSTDGSGIAVAGPAGHGLLHGAKRRPLGADLRQHERLCPEPGRDQHGRIGSGGPLWRGRGP